MDEREREREVSVLLARRVLSLRTDAALTQAQLARAAGVTTETVVRMERAARGAACANPSLRTLRRVAAALGVGTAELLMEGGPRMRKNDAELSHFSALPKEVRRRLEAVARVLARSWRTDA